MSYQTKMQAEYFHGFMDTEQYSRPRRFVETTETKYFIIQERDVNYRFYLHQHPYVKELGKRLTQKGILGLQSADTEYEPNGTSLPGSIEISLKSKDNLTIEQNSRIALLSDLQATSDGVPVDLSKEMEFRLALDVQSTVSTFMKAILVDGMTDTHLPGETFRLKLDFRAMVIGDTNITLIEDTPICLPDGKTAILKEETEVLLFSDAFCILPTNIEVQLLKSKARPLLFSNEFFSNDYKPSSIVKLPYPVKDLDFSSNGAYSAYNWELFFHVPFTTAIQLSKNQRFAEAQQWFHYLFDPTDNSDGSTPERFWKVRPFQYTDVKKIEEIMVNLATGADETLRNETICSIDAWSNSPFRPHVIARYRQQAYMYKTVMAYLDNLIAWGDSMFRQDTGEAIDEAMMLYVLAANILGPRPLPVPKKGSVRPQTYANLRQDIKQFGIVLRDMEADLPFDLIPFPSKNSEDNSRLSTLRSLGKALYFCIPRNDKLLSYWDTIADRLFKIRNSLNFQGVFRQLALFEPPIDPAMLARATAAGLDVSAIINGLNQPLPLVRFQLLIQKAAEIVQEVKSLGNNLLSSMEKEDSEAMAILRAKHERVVMEMVEHIKYGQHQEAIKSKEGLIQSLAMAVQSYSYYEKQLGKKPEDIEKAIPELDDLDTESLEKMKFSMKEPEILPHEIEVDIAQDLGESGGKNISSYELRELNLSHSAQKWRDRSSKTSSAASLSYYIPTFATDVHFWGMGFDVEFGGKHVGPAIQAIAEYFSSLSAQDTYDASRVKNMDMFQRREQELTFQSNSAAGEITQIFKQLRASQIREAIAEKELENHRQQMKHAEEIESFLNEEGTEKKGKKTNKALYAWMKREVKGLYSQSFQFAFDIARKAERALQHELGNPELSYLKFGYLTGKEGLLAGEKLHLDIKRMEMAYHELNQREYELTKHASLLQVDPMALIKLRMTGKCTVKLPESLFDMDAPGQYFRRIKTVAISIPCLTGPYISVNCKLTLLKSCIRKKQILLDDLYAREDAEDSRFDDYFGSLQSIVTSSAQNDSGLFETNLRDERFLPFENSGVISEWQLELPADPSQNDPQQFDYQTISDVIFHIRYTAREGGSLLRSSAISNNKALILNAEASGSKRLFSLRHEFPTEWAKFQSQTPAPKERFELILNLKEEHYPFWSKKRLDKVLGVDILAQSTEAPIEIFKSLNTDDITPIGELTTETSLGNLLFGPLISDLPAKPDGVLKLFFNTKAIANLWIAVKWSGKVS